MKIQIFRVCAIAIIIVSVSITALAQAQPEATVLTGPALTRVVPTGFFYQGLSAPTQMRNSAAARFGSNRFVVVGMVDTSGYAADVRAKYEGFFITDSSVSVGGSELATGAYGFGFSDAGKLNIFDLAGNEVLSVNTTRDAQLRRPRPLIMVKSGNHVRLYSGRNYAEIAPR